MIKDESLLHAYRKLYKKLKYKCCKIVVPKILPFDDYKNSLFDGIYKENTLFRTKKHKVYTVNNHKIVFNNVNDKKYMQAYNIKTLTRGYFT